MPLMFTEEEVAEFASNISVGLDDFPPDTKVISVFKSEDAAKEALDGWVEHMTAGGYTVGRMVE